MPQPLAPQMGEPLATVGHAVPQSRQCAGSLAVSTQAPPQLVEPLGQSLTHLPSEQAWSVAHGLSQPPQLAGLVLMLTQAVPHSAKPRTESHPQSAGREVLAMRYSVLSVPTSDDLAQESGHQRTTCLFRMLPVRPSRDAVSNRSNVWMSKLCYPLECYNSNRGLC